MRHSSIPLFLVPLLLPLLLMCSSGDDDPFSLDDLGDGLKVLFIGNSLTGFNDLPALVRTVAEARDHDLAVRGVIKSNYSLEDHWYDGDARRAIQGAEWDVVVLQQGPSSLIENRIHLREWSERFDTLIREMGGRPALYMVWPEEARRTAFGAVSQSYTAAAEAVNGMLFPVGEAWRLAWQRDAGIDLYGPDRFHPSELGSVLAALVIHQQLFDDSPVGFPSMLQPRSTGLPTITLSEEDATTLQEAAAEANELFGRR
jgi:hypothetical protein